MKSSYQSAVTSRPSPRFFEIRLTTNQIQPHFCGTFFPLTADGHEGSRNACALKCASTLGIRRHKGLVINWDAITSVGELAGLVLILVFLVYLAAQTRSINGQSQAEARYAFVQAMADINMVIAQNTATASIWRRGLDDIHELTEDERMQFFMLVGQYSTLWSVMPSTA